MKTRLSREQMQEMCGEFPYADKPIGKEEERARPVREDRCDNPGFCLSEVPY